MPELPEVESTCVFLDERVRGDTVVAAEVFWPRTVGGNEAKFRRAVESAQIDQVFRRAKLVCFRLKVSHAQERYLSVHMRMSGSFDVIREPHKAEKHDRLILRLESGASIVFTDPRKFGRAKISESIEELSAGYGIEPLSEAFTVEALAKCLQRSRALKPLLLDQSVIAGLGNIYVDEVLWHSKLHPLRPASSLRAQQIELLHQSIQLVLRDAIKNLGTDFGDGVFEMGGYQPVVYGRTGEPCRRCGRAIRRLVVGQRGTHVCGHCQQPLRGPRARGHPGVQRGPARVEAT